MRFEEAHRILLQTLMQAGIMSDRDLQAKVAVLFSHNNSAPFYVGMMNTRLQTLGMEIKSASSEFTGEKHWMLMSTTVDSVRRFQTEFSQPQLDLLRKVFQEIITSNDGHVSSLACLNLPMENQLSKEGREEFLKDCVGRKWLDNKEGHYYMGVRSIIELMPYFKANYEDGFNLCPLCKQAVFHGRRCEGCQTVAHLYCLANHASIQKHLKCMNCKEALPTDDLPEPRESTTNGESTIMEEEEFSQKRMRHSSKSRTRR